MTHIVLFNEFQDEESKDIIGKALLDENFVMQGSKNKNYVAEAQAILSQLRLQSVRLRIKEIEAKIKSSNEYSPEILELLTAQQSLKNEQLELERSLKTI